MTSNSSSARRLVFPQKQKVHLEAFDPGEAGPAQVRIQTHLSLMSTGTENIIFHRLFDPGTHWDQWVQYPFHPGYASVGVVESAGRDVTTLRVGDRVAFRAGHLSHCVAEAKDCHLIPQEVSFERAVWFAFAKIAFNGVIAANYHIGDRVLVIGAGPIGQMSIRWAKVAGAISVISVDTAPQRLELAIAGGANLAIEASIDRARDSILQAGKGRLPGVVVDSTGNAAVFSAALGITADRGTLVLLGDTGQPGKQTLTADVIVRGLNIIGAHDGHDTSEWNTRTITELFFSLVRDGRFPLDGLTSHTFSPDQCAEAYATADRDRAITMGILFNWIENART